jgi:hypothetical protein
MEPDAAQVVEEMVMLPIKVLVVADGVTIPNDENDYARHGITFKERVTVTARHAEGDHGLARVSS